MARLIQYLMTMENLQKPVLKLIHLKHLKDVTNDPKNLIKLFLKDPNSYTGFYNLNNLKSVAESIIQK